MRTDIDGMARTLEGYSKYPNEYGNFCLKVEYRLKEIDLNFLRQLFNINPNHSASEERDMILNYKVNKDQAEALQPYVLNGDIDINKYDFMLSCYQTPDKS